MSWRKPSRRWRVALLLSTSGCGLLAGVQDLPAPPDASAPHDASVDQTQSPRDGASAHPEASSLDAGSRRDARGDTEGADAQRSHDAGADARSSHDAGADARDDKEAAAPAGDAGAWKPLGTTGGTTEAPSGAPTEATSAVSVHVGDLIVFACATGSQSVSVTMTAPAGVFGSDGLTVLPAAGPAGGLLESVAWGVVRDVPTVGTVTMTATSGTTGYQYYFQDCYLSVYRGGRTPVQLESAVTSGDMSGDPAVPLSCGPVATQAGGVAFYLAAMVNCAGEPANPLFTQRGDLDGNPYGDWAPTNKADASTTFQSGGGCPQSFWLCFMGSFPP